MLAIMRRFLATLTALALTSQLALGQSACAQMEMSTPSGESAGMSHGVRPAPGASVTEETPAPETLDAPDCFLAGSCLSSVADPSASASTDIAEKADASIEPSLQSAHSRALRPEPPPPRA